MWVTRKIVSEMTYNVSSGTLNSTIPYRSDSDPKTMRVGTRRQKAHPNKVINNVPYFWSPGIFHRTTCYLFVTITALYYINNLSLRAAMLTQHIGVYRVLPRVNESVARSFKYEYIRLQRRFGKESFRSLATAFIVTWKRPNLGINSRLCQKILF